MPLPSLFLPLPSLSYQPHPFLHQLHPLSHLFHAGAAASLALTLNHAKTPGNISLLAAHPPADSKAAGGPIYFGLLHPRCVQPQLLAEFWGWVCGGMGFWGGGCDPSTIYLSVHKWQPAPLQNQRTEARVGLQKQPCKSHWKSSGICFLTRATK